MRFDTVNPPLSELPQRAAQRHVCAFCAIGDQPVKMKRQWIHHVPETGHIIVCDAMRLKPRS